MPYCFLEVIGGAGEALPPRDYFGEAYALRRRRRHHRVHLRRRRRQVPRRRRPAHLAAQPERPAGQPVLRGGVGADAVRQGAWCSCRTTTPSTTAALSYRDGNVFRLANVWMLAQPYGYPSILSSFAFDWPAGNSMGPPSDANGEHHRRDLRGEPRDGDGRPVGVRAPRPVHPEHGRASAASSRAPTSTTGGTTAPTRSPSRAATRASWPSTGRAPSLTATRRHGAAAGHLLRPPDRWRRRHARAPAPPLVVDATGAVQLHLDRQHRRSPSTSRRGCSRDRGGAGDRTPRAQRRASPRGDSRCTDGQG